LLSHPLAISLAPLTLKLPALTEKLNPAKSAWNNRQRAHPQGERAEEAQKSFAQLSRIYPARDSR